MTPWAIHSTAREFRVAFERCYGNGLPAEHGVPNALIPGVVCLVFAIELCLKAIHAFDGSAQTGHNLRALFDKLPEKSRAEIIFESNVEATSFVENLTEVSNAFVEWRYIHEGPGYRSISVQYLEMLWTVVNTVAQRRVEVERAARRAAKEKDGAGTGDV